MDPDHLAVYRSFNSHKVKYLLVGGLAAVLYGSPRLTKDLDLFIEPTLENATRALEALKAAHFGTAELTTPQQLLAHEVTLFQDYVRLDLLTVLKGIAFKEAWRHRVTKEIHGVRFPVISMDHLIQSKKAVARSIDLEDVKVLQKLRARKI